MLRFPMMFPYAQKNEALAALFDSEDFTLEQVLDVDGVVDELQRMEGQIMNYFEDEVVLGELLVLAFDPPPEDATEQRKVKFPDVATSVLKALHDSQVNVFLEVPSLFAKLTSFLERDHIDVKTAGSFGAVWENVLSSNCPDAALLIRESDVILANLLKHIAISPIANAVVHTVQCFAQASTLQWFVDVGKLIPRLIEIMTDTAREDSAYQATRCMTEISSFLQGASLLKHDFGLSLFSEDTLESMLTAALTGGSAASVDNCLHYLTHTLMRLALVIDPPFIDPALVDMPMEETSDELKALARDAQRRVQTKVCAHLPDFVTLLDTVPDTALLLSNGDNLTPPCGPVRLKVTELFSYLLSIESTEFEEAILNLNVLTKLCELFFAYPWNNTLHCSVVRAIACAARSETPGLAASLTGAVRLHEQLATASARSAKVVEDGGVRLGYMGHVICMANALTECEAVADDLAASEEWVAFRDGELANANARQSSAFEDTEGLSRVMEEYKPDVPQSSVTDLQSMLFQILGVEQGGNTVADIFSSLGGGDDDEGMTDFMTLDDVEPGAFGESSDDEPLIEEIDDVEAVELAAAAAAATAAAELGETEGEGETEGKGVNGVHANGNGVAGGEGSSGGEEEETAAAAAADGGDGGDDNNAGDEVVEKAAGSTEEPELVEDSPAPTPEA